MALGATLYTGTTPTFTLTFTDIDLTIADDILVTISDALKNVIVEIGGDDLVVTPTTIEFTLTQEQTLSLPKTVLLQANWIYDDGGQRSCSNTVQIIFADNLHQEVMTT